LRIGSGAGVNDLYHRDRAYEGLRRKPRRTAMNVIATTAWNVGKSMDGDPIIAIASQVEKVKTLAEAEEGLRAVVDAINFNLFKFGGFIVVAQKLFDEANSGFKGCKNFREYIEKGLGIRYGKAMHAARIYRKLRYLGIPWSAFENIGWTKVLILLDVITKDNVEQWVAKAKEKNNGSLKSLVDAEKTKGSPVTTKIFKLHEDQKQLVDDALAKMKEESGTESDAVALEYIIQNYMGAGIQFQNWDQALTYAAKHQTDDPYSVVAKVINRLEALFPSLEIDVKVTLKEAPATA
jgi:hypothetical protein